MSKNLPEAPQGEFVLFRSEDGQTHVECRFESDTLWLSQSSICELYGKAKATISEHISNVFAEGELVEDSVVRFYRTTADDGKRYNVKYFNLSMILAIGYRVRSVRGTQFRQWATQTLDQFLSFNDREVLQGAGEISKKTADEKAKEVFDIFAQKRRRLKEIEGARANIAALKDLLKRGK